MTDLKRFVSNADIQPVENTLVHMHIETFRELEQYRSIGTVEEVKNAYGRGYNQGSIDRAEELQKCREYGYNKAIDKCIRIIEETVWKDTDMLVESIRELKGSEENG